MTFRIIRNDITKVAADAIVNTANPDVRVGRGVDYAIYEAAGREKLLAARTKIGKLAPGEVALTPAFDLPAKYIIHSSGPVWQDGTANEEKLLRRCYDSALEMAADYGCKSIAFPLMATGEYRFPEELGLAIATEAFYDFLEEQDMEIILVVFNNYAYRISGDIFDEVESYIDEKKVAEISKREKSQERIIKKDSNASEGAKPKGKRAGRRICSDTGSGTCSDAGSGTCSDAGSGMPLGRPTFAREVTLEYMTNMSLEDRLKDMYTDSFASRLQQFINKKGLKNSEVYSRAGISKQYFSKLLKGQVNPSKNKVLMLALGLRLNMDEAVDLLRLAGYAFSPVSQLDIIVQYFIEREKYDVMKLNLVLFDYGLPCVDE